MKTFTSFLMISVLFGLASAEETMSTHERPYQGLVMLSQDSKDICSVILVNEEWVLTARLCYQLEGAEVHFGTNKWCVKNGSSIEVQYDDTHQSRTVKRILEHPDGTNDEYPGQAFVMGQLNAPFNLTEEVNTAKLATQKPEVGVTYSMSGWGSGSLCNMSIVDAHKIEDSSCNSTWGRGDVFGNEICVTCGETGKEINCQADTGSPMSKDGEVYGLVVRTKPQAENGGFPITLVIPVYPYSDWIQNNIQSQE